MSIAAAVLFVVVMAWRLVPAHDRVLQLILVAIVVWAAISVLRFRHSIRREYPGAAAVAGVEYYRKELERRRDHLKSEWLWHGPLVLACLMLFAILRNVFPNPQRLRNVLPLVVLLVAWTAFGFVRRRRQAREVQKEIDDIVG
jgi:hypothetical protein